ncbi:MAG: GspH/FimT family pseudopilin [Methylophaga sp.]|nr:GspH/FimT family pseudopilin [Methylophaga sp.]
MDVKHKGFTLIELMITLTVLGIIAAIALPNFKSILDGRKLVGAADNLYATLQYARSESIKQNTNVEFQLNAGAWCYGIDDEGGNCDCTNPATCTIDGVIKVYDDSDYGDVVMSNASVNEILFDARNGEPDSAGSFTFSLPDGRTKTVNINPIGLVTVN